MPFESPAPVAPRREIPAAEREQSLLAHAKRFAKELPMWGLVIFVGGPVIIEVREQAETKLGYSLPGDRAPEPFAPEVRGSLLAYDFTEIPRKQGDAVDRVIIAGVHNVEAKNPDYTFKAIMAFNPDPKEGEVGFQPVFEETGTRPTVAVNPSHIPDEYRDSATKAFTGQQQLDQLEWQMLAYDAIAHSDELDDTALPGLLTAQIARDAERFAEKYPDVPLEPTFILHLEEMQGPERAVSANDDTDEPDDRAPRIIMGTTNVTIPDSPSL